eukprot:GHVU01233179.1.p4 GENE.GHVU01233179.1~~GHVU01233179.1.p4  ORF type:complete len:170 (+),score=23.47 GHVU01233179.1:1125-1634(+)
MRTFSLPRGDRLVRAPGEHSGNPGLTYAYENFAVSLATTFRTPAVVVSHLGHCSRYVGGCTALKDQVAHHARVLQQKVMKLQRGRRILVLAHSIGGYIVQEMTTWDPSLERSIIVGLLCPTLTQFKAKANRKIRFIAHPLVMAVSRFLLPLLRFFVSSFLTDQVLVHPR